MRTGCPTWRSRSRGTWAAPRTRATTAARSPCGTARPCTPSTGTAPPTAGRTPRDAAAPRPRPERRPGSFSSACSASAGARERRAARFPLLRYTVGRAGRCGRHMQAGAGGRILILVVERDPHVRELEAHFLAEAGYAVEFAVDGHAALARARELHPDVVITEVLVPRLDGLALCRSLKQDPATDSIAVVVFSILSAQSRAEEAGADAFLRKPLAEHRLLGTVTQLLARRSPPRGGEANP